MSNEYKDWLRDKIEDNKILIEKYPFLQIKNNAANPYLKLNSYEDTWFAEIPEAWVTSFGYKMCDELMDTLGNYANEWVILQLKEKWGMLRIYHTGLPNDISDKVNTIISKYEEISARTCAICGKYADKFNSGWVHPACDEHYKG